jgi:arsenite methyltransferase
MNTSLSRQEAAREKIRAAYSEIAEADGQCASSCGCRGKPDDRAAAVGYSPQDLAALPKGANMGLFCGNPNALAELKPGEVALDLGCGGGFDVFIAGRRVGAAGRAIGVDMTPSMLTRARRNTVTYRRSTGLGNVEFRLGEIEHLPVADASVDAVISNCVINLSTDKPQVWREIARVLRPGGRVAVSDSALLKPLPRKVAEMDAALVGCVAGAVLVSETERMAREAGLEGIVLSPHAAHAEVMNGGEDTLEGEITERLPAGAKQSDYVTSLEITARKPEAAPGP